MFIISNIKLFLGSFSLLEIILMLCSCSKSQFISKVLTALRFYASGSYQQDIGENCASALSQSLVSKCMTDVSNAFNISDVLNKYVKFPNTIQKLNSVRQG